jgi:NADH-quinone oxidoreductase subunit G
MPTLTIDGREITVPEGTKVIDAAEQLGIMIPRFCYHKALGNVGACRMCAVKFVDGPVKGVEMSCMTNAADGMVVSTTAPEAVEFRRYVIEWLMLNHPHDCPVCDEGGHCLLQDETVSGGHGLRRYKGKKRTYVDQYLGEFVQHEMNRCIHCWRCRRFYQEFAGYRDLGALQIASHMYFGRFEPGPLESPFAGNIIDLCPTGVFTDKPARYKGRRWDFERHPSLCLHCSLGCNTVGSARYRQVMRQEARLNEAVNGYFICDRGRFGFAYANDPERPRQARVDGKAVAYDEGVQQAAARLQEISQNAGPQAVACWGSSRCSLETQAELTRLGSVLEWQGPRFFLNQPVGRKVKRAVSRLDARLAISLREIEKAEVILVVGADPINEAPMLALALRQAWRQGGSVTVLDPRPVFLPFEFRHLPVLPGDLDTCLQVLGKMAFEGKEQTLETEAQKFWQALPAEFPGNSQVQDFLAETAELLQPTQNPIIVCGTDIVRESTPEAAADLANLLQAGGREAKIFYLLPGPNAFGAALLSPPDAKPEDPLEAIERGEMKALVVVESDPYRSYPDQERLSRALGKLELLVVLDYLPSPTAAQAQVVLPPVTVFERTPTHFVNQEGRLQQATPLHEGGTPIMQVSGGDHPPRDFLDYIPGGEPRAAAEILRELADALTGEGGGSENKDIWEWLAEGNGVFSQLADLRPAARTDIRLVPDKSGVGLFSATAKAQPEEMSADRLELLLVDQTFGTEELAGYSPFIQKVEGEPHIFLHPDTAAELGLTPGGRVVVHLPGGEVTVTLKTADHMARRVAVLPRHRRLDWQKIRDWPVWLAKQDFEKR